MTGQSWTPPSSIRRWLPLAAAVLLVAPTLGSALFLDDWIYLTGARLLTEIPPAQWHTVELSFLGQTVPAHAATHPYGAWAWLVPLLWAAGGSDADFVLQMGSLAWLLLLLVSAILYVRREAMGGVAWLLLAVPSVLLLAHRLMPDLPFTALGAGALACTALAFRARTPRGRWLAAGGLALCLTAAWLMAYQALALLVVCMIAVWFSPQAQRRQLGVAVAVPTALFAVGQLYSWWLLGRPHLFIAGEWFSGSMDTSMFSPGMRLWTLLGYLGAFGAPALGVALVRCRGWMAWSLPLAVVVGAGMAILLGWGGNTAAVQFRPWLMLAVGAGVAQLWLLAVAAWRATIAMDHLRLMAAGWGLAAFVGSWWLLPVPLARYLLPVHLVVALLAVSWPLQQSRLRPIDRCFVVVAWAGVGLWILLGFGISLSDAARADATERMVEALPGEASLSVVVGESGFRIAAERRGMSYLVVDDAATDARWLHSDVAAVPAQRVDPTLLARLGPPVEAAAVYRSWVSVIDWSAGADFYYPWPGSLPFTFPAVDRVTAISYPVAPPLSMEAEAALACLEHQQKPDGHWPTYVRWQEQGGWEEVHSVFTTAEVLIGLAQLPPHPRIEAMAARGLAALEADRDDNGIWRFYGRVDRLGERPGIAWEITPDADDTARAVLALRAWGRRVDDQTYRALAAQILADGSVNTWFHPPERQLLTDTNRVDPVVAAAVVRALEDTLYDEQRDRALAYIRAIPIGEELGETTYYQGAPRIAHEISLALGTTTATRPVEDWPQGGQGESGCWPRQPTFYGAREAGRPAYGSDAEPTVAGLVGLGTSL